VSAGADLVLRPAGLLAAAWRAAGRFRAPTARWACHLTVATAARPQVLIAMVARSVVV